MGIEEICSIVWTFFLEHKIMAGLIIVMISGAIGSEKEDRTKVRNAHDKANALNTGDRKHVAKTLNNNNDRSSQTYEELTKYNIIFIFGVIWMLIGFYQWATAMSNI